MSAESLLQAVYLPPDYTEVDRYRDFKSVFEAPRADRVLAEILREAGLLASIYDHSATGPVAPDRDEIQRRLGKRELALWLVGVLTSEPPPHEESDDGHGGDGIDG